MRLCRWSDRPPQLQVVDRLLKSQLEKRLKLHEAQAREAEHPLTSSNNAVVLKSAPTRSCLVDLDSRKCPQIRDLCLSGVHVPAV